MAFTEDDLRAVLADRSEPVPLTADLVDTARRNGRSVRRRRFVLGAAGAALGALTVATAAMNLHLSSGGQVLASPEPAPPPLTGGPTNGQKQARQSVVKVTGMASQCRRTLSGTGFVFAPERVLTTAHGVAGVRGDVTVSALGARPRVGEVVLFDAGRDLAVLRVPGLTAPGLELHSYIAREQATAVTIGFPSKAEESSVRTTLVDPMRGMSYTGIYGSTISDREIYPVDITVGPGEPGSPVVAGDGTVYGLLFKAGPGGTNTGYALTSGEIAPITRQGRTANRPVSTQSCTP